MEPSWSDVRSDRLWSCDSCAIRYCDDDFFTVELTVCAEKDGQSRPLSGRRLLFGRFWGFRTLEFLHLTTSSGKRIQSSNDGDIMWWWTTTFLMECLAFVCCGVRLDDCWWLLSEPFLELVDASMAVKSRSGDLHHWRQTQNLGEGNRRGIKALVRAYRRITTRPDEVSRLWSELILVWSIGNGKEESSGIMKGKKREKGRGRRGLLQF